MPLFQDAYLFFHRLLGCGCIRHSNIFTSVSAFHTKSYSCLLQKRNRTTLTAHLLCMACLCFIHLFIYSILQAVSTNSIDKENLIQIQPMKNSLPLYKLYHCLLLNYQEIFKECLWANISFNRIFYVYFYISINPEMHLIVHMTLIQVMKMK